MSKGVESDTVFPGRLLQTVASKVGADTIACGAVDGGGVLLRSVRAYDISRGTRNGKGSVSHAIGADTVANSARVGLGAVACGTR